MDMEERQRSDTKEMRACRNLLGIDNGIVSWSVAAMVLVLSVQHNQDHHDDDLNDDDNHDQRNNSRVRISSGCKSTLRLLAMHVKSLLKHRPDAPV
jgi:hypothetical protein